ncbi:flotillin family protein [Virgibacillus halodenitrificans]|uniref:flotillin family protein n=1 Tax=Virgibacillus halodenitrificans TaxID=1482 RepID=UPI000EF52D0F|nr:flotillin family protein [Virgibacillus halodenitrificans]
MKLAGAIVILVPVLILIAVAALIGFITYKFRYRTAKSNQGLIITGPNLGDPEKEKNIFTDNEGRSLKIIRGGGHLLKMNQTATPVDLTSFQLKLTTPKVYTKGGVPIIADAVAMVAVSDSLKGIAVYAEQFLGKKQPEIENEIAEVLNANLRAILSKLSVEEINDDREKFNADVQKVAQKQLDEMGFKITALGLTDLRDADQDNGYLENLGRPLIAEAKKKAEIAEAESQKETRIYVAKTDQESEEEELRRKTEIADAQKLKDLREQANLEETGRARAKAEQAYEFERTRLSMEVQEENLKVQAQKKEEELRIQQMEKERQVRLEEEQAKVRKAKADADYYETTKKAEAEARKSEIDGQTQARVKEEQGLAEAKIRREQGLAEADVIRQKGTAEAEAKKLLAQALAEHGEVVIIEKLIDMLPLYAEKIAQPLSNIESVKIVDTGNGNGVNAYGKSITDTLVGLQEPLKELTGLDVSGLMKDLVNRGNTHTTVVVPDAKEKAEEDTNEVPVEAEDLGEEKESEVDFGLLNGLRDK